METEACPTKTAIDRSPNIADLAVALAQAQGKLEVAKKEADNPFYKSKYADLAACWDACRKPLADHGLSVCQIPTGDHEDMGVWTYLIHASGQFIGGRLSVKLAKIDPQVIGSIITYFRRYALGGIIGLSAEEDDDANMAAAAANRVERPRKTPPPPANRPPPQPVLPPQQAQEPTPSPPQSPPPAKSDEVMTDAQRRMIYARMKAGGLTDEQMETATKRYGVHKTMLPTKKMASEFIDYLDVVISDLVQQVPGDDDIPREPGEEG